MKVVLNFGVIMAIENFKKSHYFGIIEFYIAF
jgi:hypothetical protein